MAQNSIIPRSLEDYDTEISQEIERRVTKSCLRSLAGQKAAFLGSLFCLDDFPLNPLTQATPEPLQRRPGTHYIQIKERLGMTPGVFVNLKQVSLRLRLQTLDHTMLITC